MDTRNAEIADVSLFIERGMLTYFLYVEDDVGTQGVGGVNLDQTPGRYLRELMETIGVSRWEQLKGKFVRVRRQSPNSTIEAIGHIRQDRWFEIVWRTG